MDKPVKNTEDYSKRISQYKENKKPTAEKTYNKAKRKCLYCGTFFISEWEGNRRCKPCGNKDELTFYDGEYECGTK